MPIIRDKNFFIIILSAVFMINPEMYDGLFTGRGCSSGEEVAHEVVVNYYD